MRCERSFCGVFAVRPSSGKGVVAFAELLVSKEVAAVMSRRVLCGAIIFSTRLDVCRLDATKAAGLWMAALLRPRPPRDTGRDAKIHAGS